MASASLALDANRQALRQCPRASKEIEGDLTPSKLPRHSILVDYK